MGINFRDIARGFRVGNTKAESRLWAQLRNRKFLGLKFSRQTPIPYQINGISRLFVADFYCHTLKLVIELDGKIHDNQVERDNERDEILTSKGIRVVRLKNREIIKDPILSFQHLKSIILKLEQ